MHSISFIVKASFCKLIICLIEINVFLHFSADSAPLGFSSAGECHSFLKTIDFSLNVFTEFAEFSDKKYCILKSIIQTCQLLCKRPKCYNIASKTQVTEGIFKLSPIHALLIYQIHRIHWISDSFRENSNVSVLNKSIFTPSINVDSGFDTAVDAWKEWIDFSCTIHTNYQYRCQG